MSSYSLGEDVFACATDEGTVFLDLKRDRYFGIDREHTRLYQSLQRPGAGPEAEQLAKHLAALGLVKQRPMSERPLLPAPIEMPRQSLLPGTLEVPPTVKVRHWLAFGMACASVAAALRLGSLRHALRRYQRLRDGCRSNPFDESKIRELIRVFCQMRPAVYAARDHCLFDSLALADFLLRHDISTQCVFGIRMIPFEAHCWVESHGFVLNDRVEIVGRFAPLAVF